MSWLHLPASFREWLDTVPDEFPSSVTQAPPSKDFSPTLSPQHATIPSILDGMDGQGRRSSPRRQQQQQQQQQQRSPPTAELVQLAISPSSSAPPTSAPPARTLSLSHHTTFSPPSADPTSITGSSASRQRSPKRSNSPVKRRVDLFMAEPRILFLTMGVETPNDIRELNRQFANIFSGVSIMPRNLKVELDSLMDDLLDHHFDDSKGPASTHDADTLQKLRSIYGAAHRCHELEKPEPSWGHEVYWPLVRLALEIENDGQEVQLQLEDVTTTRIFPDSLLPKGTDGLPLESKRVDFALYISQTDSQKAEITELLTGFGSAWEDHSVNQTSAFYTRLLPHVCAIETKCASANDGMVQLGVWMAALRKRLEMFVDLNQQPPEDGSGMQAFKATPCLKVHHHDWDLYWCSIGGQGETLLHGPKLLGSTRDIKGTYQVLRGLREIIKYGRDDYWPWFNKRVLRR